MTEQDTPTPRRYTVREAAKVLGIGTDAVRKRIARGTISDEKDTLGVSTFTWTLGKTKGHDDLWCPLTGSSQASAWSSNDEDYFDFCWSSFHRSHFLSRSRKKLSASSSNRGGK